VELSVYQFTNIQEWQERETFATVYRWHAKTRSEER